MAGHVPAIRSENLSRPLGTCLTMMVGRTLVRRGFRSRSAEPTLRVLLPEPISRNLRKKPRNRRSLARSFSAHGRVCAPDLSACNCWPITPNNTVKAIATPLRRTTISIVPSRDLPARAQAWSIVVFPIPASWPPGPIKPPPEWRPRTSPRSSARESSCWHTARPGRSRHPPRAARPPPARAPLDRSPP
jgi:hypothetical protein